MCDNPELNISTFVSTNESVIDYLLDISDEVEDTLTTDKYRWVKGIDDKAHGGFVRKIEIGGKEGFKPLSADLGKSIDGLQKELAKLG